MTGVPAHLALATGPVYLDYNATTPVDPRVAEATAPYLIKHFGSPSSTHTYGERTPEPMAARTQQAAICGSTASRTDRCPPALRWHHIG